MQVGIHKQAEEADQSSQESPGFDLTNINNRINNIKIKQRVLQILGTTSSRSRPILDGYLVTSPPFLFLDLLYNRSLFDTRIDNKNHRTCLH